MPKILHILKTTPLYINISVIYHMFEIPYICIFALESGQFYGLVLLVYLKYHIRPPPFLVAEVLHRSIFLTRVTPTVNGPKSSFTVGVRHLDFFLRCSLLCTFCTILIKSVRVYRLIASVFSAHLIHISVLQMYTKCTKIVLKCAKTCTRSQVAIIY